MKTLPTLIGLVLALAGLPLLAWVQSQPQDNWMGYVRGPLSLILLGGSILVLILRWERLPLTSIGLKSPSFGIVVWGLVVVGIQLYIVTPLGVNLVNALNLPSLDTGVDKLGLLPKWYLLVLGTTSGCIEELLYRGYATERLGTLTGNLHLSALLTLAAFALSHLPFWGLGGVCFTLLGGSVFTGLYLWRRDLLTNMLAHAMVATIQLWVISQ